MINALFATIDVHAKSRGTLFLLCWWWWFLLWFLWMGIRVVLAAIVAVVVFVRSAQERFVAPLPSLFLLPARTIDDQLTAAELDEDCDDYQDNEH